MKVVNAVLLSAALLAECTSAAVRWEILNRHTPRQYLLSNYSLPSSQDVSTTTAAATTAIAIVTSDSAEQTHQPTTDTTILPATGDDGVGSQFTPVLSPSSFSSGASTQTSYDDNNGLIRNSNSTPTTFIDNGTSTTDMTSLSATDYSYNTDTQANTNSASTSSCQSDASNCLPTTQPIGSRTMTFPGNFSVPSTTSSEQCTPLPSNRPIIKYSIVYTSTITFYGNSTDYTPPYEPIKTPYYCTNSPQRAPEPPSLTITITSLIFNSTVTTAVLVSPTSKPNGFGIPLSAPLPPATIPIPDNSEDPSLGITLAPAIQFSWGFITFITTEKNPSVVFSSQTVPGYSQTWNVGNSVGGDHKTVEGINDGQPRPITPIPVDSAKLPPQPTFSVTAGGNQVVINDKTVTGLRPGQTTTVIVGSETFTIFPTAVVGLGSTITKPPPENTAAPTPTPTSKVLGGVSVTVSGSQAVIGGTTLSIPSAATTTTINGRRVVVGPGGIAVGGQTLTFQAPQPSNTIISGGEMLTAIGRSIVVLHSTTITYGPNIPESQTVINGETISIGPNGVSFQGTAVGGPSADATDTNYGIVGGITVAKLLPSLVVVNGATYTIKGDRLQTTVIGNQTITIGPSGVIVSSTTLTYPPDASVTTTLSPSGTWANNLPAETGSEGGSGKKDDDSAAFAQQPNVLIGVICLCMAIGVWILV